MSECFFFANKDYYSELYDNLMGKKYSMTVGSYVPDLFYVKEKKDNDGYSAVHLAVMCNGPDIEFEQTVKVLSKLT